jgi:hypothetical protein
VTRTGFHEEKKKEDKPKKGAEPNIYIPYREVTKKKKKPLAFLKQGVDWIRFRVKI